MNTIGRFIQEKIEAVERFTDEEQIRKIVKEVRANFSAQCKYFYAGGFDSPGYDIDCYVIAYIDTDGTLGGEDIQIETY